jgi:hypothetical protein
MEANNQAMDVSRVMHRRHQKGASFNDCFQDFTTKPMTKSVASIVPISSDDEEDDDDNKPRNDRQTNPFLIANVSKH